MWRGRHGLQFHFFPGQPECIPGTSGGCPSLIPFNPILRGPKVSSKVRKYRLSYFDRAAAAVQHGCLLAGGRGGAESVWISGFGAGFLSDCRHARLCAIDGRRERIPFPGEIVGRVNGVESNLAVNREGNDLGVGLVGLEINHERSGSDLNGVGLILIAVYVIVDGGIPTLGSLRLTILRTGLEACDVIENTGGKEGDRNRRLGRVSERDRLSVSDFDPTRASRSSSRHH
jgi:hypothetical protein